MVAGLGAEFYLAQSAVSASGRLVDGLREELRIHKMGAGTGGKKTAVLYQPYSPQVDLTVNFVKAGGSKITTSNSSPDFSKDGSRSNTSAH